MLKEAIADDEAKRISEAQYLSKVQDIMNNVLTHTDDDIPERLRDRIVAKAFYGLTVETLTFHFVKCRHAGEAALLQAKSF